MDKLFRWGRKHRKGLGAASLAAAVALIFCIVYSPTAVSVMKADRSLPIYCVEREEKLAALSFDAAWGNEDTEQLIEILDQYGVKATFFVVGDWAEKYPESVKALHDAGHEVMSHSDDHAHFNELSSQEIADNINASCDRIETITGVRPLLFRCPYGEYNNNVIDTVNSMGMYTIQWDVDSLDWKGLSAEQISKRVREAVRPGSIVLFHNAAENTPEALPEIIEFLQAQAYSLVPVSELLLEGEYEIDHTGKMCPAAE